MEIFDFDIRWKDVKSYDSNGNKNEAHVENRLFILMIFQTQKFKRYQNNNFYSFLFGKELIL